MYGTCIEIKNKKKNKKGTNVERPSIANWQLRTKELREKRASNFASVSNPT